MTGVIGDISMRLKKSMINSISNILIYFISMVPLFIVRKVFLNQLGDELLSVNSLFSDIIGMMSIFELGIGTAIVFSLYKPFAVDDRIKIKGYLDYYQKFYRRVGLIILVVGLVLAPFISKFIKVDIKVPYLGFYFILYLVNTVISYFFTYKTCILQVAQQGYKLTLSTALSKLAISSFQIIVLIKYQNYYLYLLLEIVINLIYYILINRYIDKKYEWLSQTKGKIEKSEEQNLIKNIKAMFMHKIGSLVINSTDSIVIANFVNLISVGKFKSYRMVIAAVETLTWKGMSGIIASIGNLIAEEDEQSIYLVHKRLFFLNFWMVSFIIISLFNTLNQFIVLWLGVDQLIDSLTFVVILLNCYFSLMRSSVESFKEGAGVYHEDRYAPLAESIINLVASIILVQWIGLPGVFLGTMISNLTVVFWIKPLVVYRHLFKRSVLEYFKTYFKYVLIAIIPLILSSWLTAPFKYTYTIGAFSINVMINILVINILYLIIFWKNNEFDYFKSILIKIGSGLYQKLKG